METHPKPLVPIVRIGLYRWPMDEVENGPVTVHQAPSQRDDVRLRDIDGSQGQALAWRQPDRPKPLVQPRVVKLGEIHDTSGPCPCLFHAIRPAKDIEVRLHE